MNDFSNKTVIFANGVKPEHAVPLQAVKSAARIICCDGAVDKLVELGFQPDLITGDMDSISDSARELYKERIVLDLSQDRNDLTKAFKLCLKHGWHDIVVVGATGGREDHTLGNLSLLVDFVRQVNVVLLSDSGVFIPLRESAALVAESGQQISIFSFDSNCALFYTGLKYPLNGIKINRWWQAALNEAVAESVKLDFEGGPLLVFLAYVIV
jgi:thiamine pyrophosphokinase